MASRYPQRLPSKTGNQASAHLRIRSEWAVRPAIKRKLGFHMPSGNYLSTLTHMIPRASIRSLEATIGTMLSIQRRSLSFRGGTPCQSRPLSHLSRPLGLITVVLRSDPHTLHTLGISSRCHNHMGRDMA